MNAAATTSFKGITPGRLGRKALTLALLCAATVAGLSATPAVAAPSLDIELTRDEALFPTVFRSDKRTDYTVKVTNTASPTPTVGDVLTCDANGALWFNITSPATAFTFRWLRDGDLANPVGETTGGGTSTYTVQASDAGHSLQCVVVGANANGAALSFARPVLVDPVPTSPPPPSFSANLSDNPRPTVVRANGGSDLTGLLTCSAPSTWSGPATGTADTLSGSNVLSNVSDAQGFGLGEEVIGRGIPARATVTAIGAGTLTLSANATATASGVAIAGVSFGVGATTAGSNVVSNVVTAAGTGTTTSGSTAVTGLNMRVGRWAAGLPITGPGIAAGTTVAATSGSGLTLSQAATVSGAGVSLRSTGPQPFAVGQRLTAPGIPAGATITAVGAGTLTMSANATATASPVALSATTAGQWAFQWTRNSQPIPGATSAGYALKNTATVNTTNGSNQLTGVVTTTGTGTLTTGSTTVTGVTATTGGYTVGQEVTGPGIPAGTTITSIAPNGNLTLSANVTETGERQLSAGGQPFAVGQVLNAAIAAGIPAGTTITAVNGQTVTMSANATATATGVNVVAGPDPSTNVQCVVLGKTGTGGPPSGGSVLSVSSNNVIPPAPTSPNVPVNGNQSTPFTVFGQNDTSGPVTVEVELPGGSGTYADRIAKFGTAASPPDGWSCSALPASGLEPAKAICTSTSPVAPGGSFPEFVVRTALGTDAPDHAVATATVSGGGATGSDSASVAFDFAPAKLFGLETFETFVLDEAGDPYTQAGGHPFSAGESFAFNTYRTLRAKVENAEFAYKLGVIDFVRKAITDVPRGFVGNVLAIDELCPTIEDVTNQACPPGSAVGEITKISLGPVGGDNLSNAPLFAVEPEFGRPAQFAFYVPPSFGTYVVYPTLRADDGYAISLDTAPIQTYPPIGGVDAKVCSYGAALNPAGRAVVGCKQPGDPGAFVRPLVSLPPRCGDQPPTTVLRGESWQNPGVFASASFTDPPQTGCELVQFDPEIDFAPTSTQADSASGLDVELSMPSDGLEDPDGVAQAHLRKTVVELPEGVSVNPSAATGLEGCSDAQLGLGTNDPVWCPDGSRIASIEVTTPVLEETLGGVMVLRTPKSTDPMSGEMLRMALIVRNDERGILVKVPGSATADPQTGKLTATFDENPELPIATVEVKVKGGSRGVLAMPQDCGERSIESELSPWKGDANTNANDESFSDQFDVGGDCSERFAPALAAGNSNDRARGSGTFSFEFSRKDGEQWLRGLTAKLPRGLLASVGDVPLCSNVQADAGSCPAESKVGIVDAKAGSGDPFVLERKGEVFLTEGYKGGEYGLAVKIRPVAGPFRGEHELSPIVVRQAIHVDRTTADVSVVSDPFPLIHHGVPLRTREVTVLVDRDRFMLNPSDCSAKQTSADLLSAEGVTAGLSSPFQATGCAGLPFRPRLELELVGRRQVTTGTHPRVKAVVTQQGTSEAGIEKAVVRLPKSLALDPDNAQALCEFEDGTKPDLENHCPEGSIVGRARAKTPLLEHDLVGNVYFVKNIRIDKETGNQIRTLPMIIVALRGEVAINLRGESDTTKAGKLVNTFDNVPDAPISQFNLNIKGGSNGILAVTRTRRAMINLCAGRHIAEADMDGHSGRRFDRDVRMKTPCTKRQTRNAKRAAKKAARKARNANR